MWLEWLRRYNRGSHHRRGRSTVGTKPQDHRVVFDDEVFDDGIGELLANLAERNLRTLSVAKLEMSNRASPVLRGCGQPDR
ncbi:hypothetical protein BH24ACT2_BH24ACT2_08600 [soil metagenome]